MTEVEETKKETQEDIIEILTKDEFSHDTKLQVLKKLKKLFKPTDEIFCKLKLESLLQGARTSLEIKSEKPKKDYLYHYGVSLISAFGRNTTLGAEVLYQLEYVLEELKKEDESLTGVLMADVWSKFEITPFFQPSRILDMSKQTIEKTVLDWVDNPRSPRIEFFSKISAYSPKLFQTLTSILHVVLVRTQGSEKVFDVITSFITSVKRVCQKEAKNFLGLYPKGCCRLVSLLMIPPEIYFEENEDIFNEVLSLLLEMFIANRIRALILLSHYSKWVRVFKMYVDGSVGVLNENETKVKEKKYIEVNFG